MTTQETAGQAYINVESLFLTLLKKLEAASPPGKDPALSSWLRPTAQAIINLPWGETDLPDNRKHPQYATAAELLLLRVLEHDTPPPNSVNTTGEGGATAQWHLHGYDLEIFCEPDRVPDYYLKTPDTEYEGPIHQDQDWSLLRSHLRLMPAVTAHQQN